LHQAPKNRRASIGIVPDILAELFQRDPFLGYTLVAALFLGIVSLVTGWLRLDFLAVFQPKGLFHVAVAVIVAIVFSLVSQSALAPFTANAAVGETSLTLSLLRGLSRLPLYIVALAYGPTAGLLAAGLFAAFATTSGTLGWAEAVLALELVVLGWFAIAPSPFKLRWAGPMNVVLAYFLAWATGGSAYLQHLTKRATELSIHWEHHQTLLVGIFLSVLVLFLLRPKVYQSFFAGSRIAPPPEPLPAPVIPQTIQLRAELAEREQQRQRGKLTEFPLESVAQLRKNRDKS
jgi:hypothetical protein